MSDTQRTVVTFCLIALLTLCIPFYLQFIGVSPENSFADSPEELVASENSLDQETVVNSEKNNDSLAPNQRVVSNSNAGAISFVVQTQKYRAEVSNVAGGSLVSFTLIDSGRKSYQYLGGYNEDDEYSEKINVNLLQDAQLLCSPCLNLENTNASDLNIPFVVESPAVSQNQIFNIASNDSLVLKMSLQENGSAVVKETVFYGDSYIIEHSFKTQNVGNINVGWNAGIRPTEKNLSEELTFSTAYVAQNKDISDLTFTPQSLTDAAETTALSGTTDWVAIRNKYFITSLITSLKLTNIVSSFF